MPGAEKARKTTRKPESPGKKAAKAAAPARSTAPARPAEKHDGGGQLKQQPDARGKYVYCIIQASEPLRFGPLGIGADPAEVHTVNYRDIAAVVSDTPVELLRSAYDAFHDVLDKMQDKLEFGLKVLWDRDVMVREIENQDEDVRRLKQEIFAQKGSTYFARMQYGRLVDAALSAHSEKYVAEIFAALRDVAVASRANKPIGDKMIMNAAFLVSRDKEQGFDQRVKEIGARLDKLTFKYTGPWPPYNFVNIRLKLERRRRSRRMLIIDK